MLYTHPIWELEPELSLQVYFINKKDFDFESEIYNDYTLFILEEGMFKYEIEGLNKSQAKPYDCILCPPNHRFIRKTITPISLHMFQFQFNNCQTDNNILPLNIFNISLIDRLKSNFALLKSYTPGYKTDVNKFEKHIFNDIWNLIRLEIDGKNNNPVIINDPLMQRVINMIHSNYQDGITVESIAEHFGYSSVMLIRKFKSVFNITPNHYINNLKLNKSKILLLETNLLIKDISQICGYNNEYYFSNKFKAQFGTSPDKFRKNNRL